MNADPTAKYLAGHPAELRAQLRVLIAEERLAGSLERRHPERHDIVSDGVAHELAHLKGCRAGEARRSAQPLSDSA